MVGENGKGRISFVVEGISKLGILHARVAFSVLVTNHFNAKYQAYLYFCLLAATYIEHSQQSASGLRTETILLIGH